MKLASKAGQAADSVVRADAIGCQRGQQPVLSELSFAAHPGDFLTFSGPNGVGKTTLLRTLIGLNSLLDGNISIPRDHCAYLGHHDGLKGELTVAENLTFWIQIFGNQLPSEDQLPFGVADLRDREIRHLSSGQRQKVALASVILSGQDIWLLDEPATGLDNAATAEFCRHVESHCKSSGIVIATTHSNFASRICQMIDLTPFAVPLPTTELPQ